MLREMRLKESAVIINSLLTLEREEQNLMEVALRDDEEEKEEEEDEEALREREAGEVKPPFEEGVRRTRTLSVRPIVSLTRFHSLNNSNALWD